MKLTARIHVIAVVCCWAAAVSWPAAQTAHGQSQGTNTSVAASQPARTDEEGSQTSAGKDQDPTTYAPALDGSGLISMNSATSRHLITGTTVSSGFDSNPRNMTQSPVASGVYTVEPYFGLHSETSNAQFLLQYQPTITGYTSQDYGTRALQQASLTMMGNMSERLRWNGNLWGSYGQDSTRFLAPQQTVGVGQVPGTGPTSAAYLPDAGTVTFVTGDAGLQYLRSSKDSFDLDISNSFSHYGGIPGNNSIASASVGYDRALSPVLGLRAYSQTYRYYGSISCTSMGGGVGIKWHAQERTYISFSGGPQLNSASCSRQQGFAYSGSLSTKLVGKSQIYVMAAREPAISYLGPGLWETSVSAGFERQMNRGMIGANFGHVSSNTLTATSSYHGTYFDCEYAHGLSHGFTASYTYRGYLGYTNGGNFTRNVALLSISWSPAPRHLSD
jgi:hypothetical protein